MRIAIYTEPLQADEARRDDREVFVRHLLSGLLASHPEHDYFLIDDAPKDSPDPGVSPGALPRYGAGTKGVLARYRKYRYRLPALLKKLNTSVILSTTGVLPLAGEVPSVLLVPNGASQDPAMERFITRADVVATLSAAEAGKLSGRGLKAPEAVTEVPTAAPETFQSLGWEARERVKEAYTQGREYFLHPDTLVDEEAVVRTLKGFSVLKKRLRSSMALVMTGEVRMPAARLTALLGNYHFRGDVVVENPGDPAKRAELVGGAYALVTASAGSGYRSAVLEALRCRVPVVAASEAALQEVTGEAGLYFKAEDFSDLGERLCDIYKFENMRAMLIAAADTQSALYHWQRTTEALWGAIVRAAEAKN
jgi:glycosyltransferase involved in cell wall biosynthesis